MNRFARFATALLVGVLLLSAAVPGFGAEGQVPPPQQKFCYNLDLSTGTTQPFTPDPFGATDPDWWVTASPDPNLTVPGPVYSIKPVPSWFTTPAVNWVDPYNTGFGQNASGYTGADPAGNYVFATTFTLNGALFTNFVLRVNVYAGDNATELFLDGNPTALGPAAGFGPPNSTAVQGPLTIPLGPGPHTLEAKVRNDGGWMGLLVDARVTGDCRPDLAIKKEARGDFVAGQNGSYLITVANVGAGNASGPIYVTDTLPAGATFVSAGGVGWTCTNSGGTVSCVNPGPLPSGQALPPIVITIVVPPGVTVVENCAVVDSTDDMNPENNRSCIGTPVDPGAPGAICGIKFHDLNGNGVQDNNEQPLAGWVIQIKDAAGNVVATVTTGKDGRYCFKELPPGLYTVSEVMQQGWLQTYPLSPGTYTVHVASAQVVQGLNFGNRNRPDEKCCLTFRFPAGRPDTFQAGNAEPADPSPGLVKWLSPAAGLADFDAAGIDKMFANTLSLPIGNCVESAYLTVRVKPNANGSTIANDTIGLYFISGSGNPVPGSPAWGAHFGSGYPNSLLPNPWGAANYPNGQVITLNLATLPGGGNLIPWLNSLRFLDVVVQDDTSVDYMVLTVKFCECNKVPPDQTKEELNPREAEPGQRSKP